MDSFKKILTIIIIGLLVFNVFSFFYMRSVKTFSPVIPEIQNITAVSYTHLTLPTIYSV